MSSQNETNKSNTTNITASSISNKLLQLMTNDDEIMKRKLMIDGDGIGDDRKLSNLIKQFILWCYNDNESELESQLSAERLLNAIDQSELAMAKSVQTIKMITHELDNYETIYKTIEKAIQDTKDKLHTCKAELAYAKQIRCYKLDYDSMANIIEKHPSTQETQQKLNVLESEIQSLQNINNQFESKLEKRRRQFQLLLFASHQLQSVLDEENESETNNQRFGSLLNDLQQQQQRPIPTAPSSNESDENIRLPSSQVTSAESADQQQNAPMIPMETN